ncbi:MAG: hypothetical protein KKC55_13830, partial [Gammaproteobacteria bacterium]|nr:hypothetical protein [Gammaproteobacteria bacterium]
DFNEQVRDNLDYLKGKAGPPIIGDLLIIEDQDATPVGNVGIQCKDEILEIRNEADDAFIELKFDCLPTGTGAAELAIGTHTHDLNEDVVGSDVSADTTDTQIDTKYSGVSAVAAGGDTTIVTTTPTFDAAATAFGAAMVHGQATAVDSIKLRLIMGGVQVAESGFMLATCSTLVAAGTLSLSGLLACTATLHNYDGGTQSWGSYSLFSGAERAAALGIASIKCSGAV